MGKEVPSGVEPYRDSDDTKDRTVEVASHEVSGTGPWPLVRWARASSVLSAAIAAET